MADGYIPDKHKITKPEPYLPAGVGTADSKKEESVKIIQAPNPIDRDLEIRTNSAHAAARALSGTSTYLATATVINMAQQIEAYIRGENK